MKSLLVLALMTLLLACGDAPAPPPAKTEAAPAARGLVSRSEGVSPGYVLFSPLLGDTTYLLDNDGRVVHTWKSETSPGGDQYLLDGGRLLRLGRDPAFTQFRTGGVGGVAEILGWNGEVLWRWPFASAEAVLHHDFEPLPNGHVLALAWEAKTPKESASVGRRADRTPKQGLWPDFVIEIEPLPPADARIVWEWRVWDHLVQNVDPALPGFGAPAENPGRLDINAGSPKPSVSGEELAQLKALGYVPDDAKPEDLESDFLHVNAIDYHAGLDQIALSVPNLGEIWIIDHGTTTAEAASGAGGKRGRGGDLLYRWGNPSAYGRGAASDQLLFYQHDVRWILAGRPGAGHLTIFNNGGRGGDADYSSVEEISPPLGADGLYALAAGEPFAPRVANWRYEAPERKSFFAPFISGAQRTPSGNTLVCSGPEGRLFEVSPGGKILWEYSNPFAGSVRMADGTSPQPVPDDQPYAVFRATRIPPDHAGLRGRALAPLAPQPKREPPPKPAKPTPPPA